MFGQSQDSCDFLQLRNESKFKVHLQPCEEVVLSTSVNKYNGEGKCQQRILVVTNMAILNILKAENIIKSFMKKFINMSNRYEIKRRILLQNLYGITISPNKTSNVFLIHVLNGHDYHYRAENNKMTIIKIIAQQYRKLTKKYLNFYFKDEIEIVNFCTTKCHLKERRDVRPKDNPVILNEDYFSNNQFENEVYVCEYSSRGQGILPKNFKKVQPANIKPGCSYYIMKQEYNRSIKVQNLYKNNHLLIPQFSFYSDKKQLLFISFISGGDLKKFIAKRLPLSKQNTIFYISQLLLFVKQLHSCGKIYSNLTLENIYVKENGYLLLNGLEKSIQDYQPQGGKLLYRVSGNPCYFPPQVIECRGYDFSIDIWKLGVCAYIFLTGRYPFQGRSVKQLYQSILYKSMEQEEIPEFVKRMLEKNRQKRISLASLFDLEIFSGKQLLGVQNEQQKAFLRPESTLWMGSPPVIYQLEEE